MRLATWARSAGPPATSSWTQNDTLLVNGDEGIYELPAEGGELVPMSRVDRNAGEYAHIFPQMLPERRALLYNVMREGAVPSGWIVKVQALDGSESKTILERASHPVYLPTGHIVFARSGALLAVPFDLRNLEVTGSPVVVVEDVMHADRGANAWLTSGTAQFSVSGTGTLAYVAGGVYPESTHLLLLVDRQGEARELPLPRDRYLHPRFSPDGKRLSYSVGNFGDAQIWVYDFGRDVKMRLTNNGYNTDPVWSPDSRSLAFGQSSVQALYAVAADGSSSPRRLGQGGRPWAWFGDVLGFIQDPDKYIEIWTLHLESGERRPFLQTDSQVWHPDLSPDGKWVAYVSEEMGSGDYRDLVDVSGFGVYVRPFPEGVPLQIIASGGAFGPAWSADGRELFFYQFAFDSTGTRRVRLMAVDVDTSSTFTRGRPRMLFEGDYRMTVPRRNYDVSPDGQQFVMSGAPFWGDPQPATKIEIVLDWFEELQALVPVRTR